MASRDHTKVMQGVVDHFNGDVLVLEDGKRIILECDIPVKAGDWINAVGKISGDGTLLCREWPEVVMPMDHKAVINMLISYGGGITHLAEREYTVLECLESDRIDRGEDVTVSDILDEWAHDHKKSPSDLRDYVTGRLSYIPEVCRGSFLTAWYRERTSRLFALLGIERELFESIDLPPKRLSQLIRINPYRVLEISEDVCERLIDRFQLEISETQRYQGRIARFLHHSLHKYGNTCTRAKYLGVKFADYIDHWQGLVEEYDVRCYPNNKEHEESSLIYLAKAYNAEMFVSNFVKRLGTKTSEPHLLPTPPGPLIRGLQDMPLEDSPPKMSDVMKNIDGFDQERREVGEKLFDAGFTTPPRITSLMKSCLTVDQCLAVSHCMLPGFHCMMGEAGTGKTTCIRELVKLMDQENRRYILSSFIGKAVARIKEVTNCPAKTIHHWMATWNNSNKKPLTVVIDEASTLSLELFYDFCCLLSEDNVYSVILVGDTNQLQPISWGSVFEQLINSKRVDVAKLVFVHRSESDLILANSHKLASHCTSHKQVVPFIPQCNKDFALLRGKAGEAAKAFKVRFVAKFKEMKANSPNASRRELIADAFHQVACVCPFRKDVSVMNIEIRKYRLELLAKEEYVPPSINRSGFLWYLGDRITILRNCIHPKVYNGDMGTIVEIMKNGVSVRLDRNQRLVMIPRASNKNNDLTMKDLSLGYAFTVDKGEGSEWEHIIFYCSSVPSYFVHNKRVYTAITRSRKTCTTVVSNVNDFCRSAGTPAPWRSEGLAIVLKNKMKQVYIPSLSAKTSTIISEEPCFVAAEDEYEDDWY